MIIRNIQTRHHILECIREIYETLFKKRKQKTTAEIKSFLSHFNIPKFSEDKSKLSDEDLTEKDLYGSLQIMKNDKSPGKDSLTKEFYGTFWNEHFDWSGSYEITIYLCIHSSYYVFVFVWFYKDIIPCNSFKYF